MAKTLMGPKVLLYPMPALLIGANVDDKPNFMTAAWCGIVNGTPPMISVAIQPRRYTHRGIRQNLTFSANIPSIDLVKETDYCGITSGDKVNKVDVCKFNLFYGKLGSAPLIEQCPINLECKVLHILELGSHSLFIGRVEESYVSESCLTDGKPDVNKIQPLICTIVPTRQYYAFGEIIAEAWSVGQELRGKE
ncbi:MAG: flavin reductase family protein [Chloroflexi bacterium]|nr:flavin reductase family protein [Chloroflexota bacterium]